MLPPLARNFSFSAITNATTKIKEHYKPSERQIKHDGTRQDVNYEQGTDPDCDDTVQADYDEEADPDYGTNFADAQPAAL